VTLDPDELSYLDDQLQTLLADLVLGGLTAVPEFGYEPPDPQNRGWQIDVAWPSVRVAAVSEIDDQRDQWLRSEQWLVQLATAWGTEELLAATKRNLDTKDTN
jgi:hypothetical protein